MSIAHTLQIPNALTAASLATSPVFLIVYEFSLNSLGLDAWKASVVTAQKLDYGSTARQVLECMHHSKQLSNSNRLATRGPGTRAQALWLWRQELQERSVASPVRLWLSQLHLVSAAVAVALGLWVCGRAEPTPLACSHASRAQLPYIWQRFSVLRTAGASQPRLRPPRRTASALYLAHAPCPRPSTGALKRSVLRGLEPRLPAARQRGYGHDRQS